MLIRITVLSAIAVVAVFLPSFLMAGSVGETDQRYAASSEGLPTAPSTSPRTDIHESTFQDDRFTWQETWVEPAAGVNKDLDRIWIHWYEEGIADFTITGYLHDAWESKVWTESLLDIDLGFPVHVWLYEDWDDMEDLVDVREEVAGSAVSFDAVIVNLDSGYPQDTIRHEIAHLVTEEATWFNDNWTDIPLWLDEGLAEFAEYSDLDVPTIPAFRNWVRVGNDRPVCSMIDYPEDMEEWDLFYGKSYLLVRDLIEEYGAKDMAMLLVRLKRGWNLDPALNATYELNRHKLEERWLGMIGLDQAAERCT